MIEIATLPGFEIIKPNMKCKSVTPRITWAEHCEVVARYRASIKHLNNLLEIQRSSLAEDSKALRLICIDSRPVPPRGRVRKGKGYVYVIQEMKTFTCKIGMSRSYKNRAEQFDVKLPFRWETVMLIQTPNYKELERELHRDYSSFRLEGEWFRLSTDRVLSLWLAAARAHANRFFGMFIDEQGYIYNNDLYIPQNEDILRPTA